LRMPSTRTRLTPELQARLAQGYDSARAPLPSAFVPPLAGVGGLRSTASDLLTLLAAQLGFVQSPLHEAMDLMTKPRRPTGIANLQIALVWHIDTTSGEDIFWHNGASAGYRAFVGFRPRGNVGVVVLSNTSTWASAEEIGLFLLHPDVTRLFNSAVVSKLETVH